jgi:hypothetical protein
MHCLTSVPVPRYHSQVNSSYRLTYALPFRDRLVVWFRDWLQNRRPDGYRITDRAASCCPQDLPARHTQMFGPVVSTNSYCTRASYDSEFKVFISSQVSFSVAYVWPATSTYPAISNLFCISKAQLRLLSRFLKITFCAAVSDACLGASSART